MADDKEKLQLEFEITYDASGEKKVLDGAKRIGDAYKTVGENAAGAVGDLAGLEKPVKGVVEEAKKLTAEKNRQIEAEKKLAAEKKRTADQEERITNALSKREKKSMDTAVAPYIERERREQDLYKKLKSGEVSATDLLSQGKKGAEAVDKMADSTHGLTNAVDAFATKVESKVSSVESVVNVVQQAETGIRNLTRELNIFDMAVAAANKDKPDAMMQRLVLWGKEQKAIEGVTAAVGKMEAPIQSAAKAQDVFAVAVAAAGTQVDPFLAKIMEAYVVQKKVTDEQTASMSNIAEVTVAQVDRRITAEEKLTQALSTEAAALENVGVHANLTAEELDVLDNIHASFAQTAVENTRAFAEEQAKINTGVSALSTAVLPAVEGLVDTSSKLTDVFNEEAAALENVATYADLSKKEMNALASIEKSFGREAKTSAKELAASQDAYNARLSESIKIIERAITKEELYTQSAKRTQEMAMGGPLKLVGYKNVQRIKDVDVSPEQYKAKLEDIKSNLTLLNEEISRFMVGQKAALDSAQADIVKARAMEDSKEKADALADATARYNRIINENSAALKQAHLLSKDYMVGLIERTARTENDGEAELILKQEVRDLANAYYNVTASVDAVNNETRLRNDGLKQELKGVKDVIAALNKLEAAERKAVLAALRDIDKVPTHFISMANTVNQITKRFGQSLTRYITVPLAGIAIKAAKFTADMEANLKSIQILLYNNAEEAKALYDQVVAYSAATPYEIPDLTEATKQLLSYGTASQNIMGELKMLGDLAQNDAKKLDSLTQAFGKSQARGAIHMRELNRFILSGIPIMDALAKVTDKTMGDIVESVQKGEVSFRMVKAAMVSLTSEGGRFHNMSAELAYTIKGRWATMSDEINLALKSFVEDYMPVLMKYINKIIYFAQALQDMTKVEKDAILHHIKLAASIGPILLGISALSASFAAVTKISQLFIASVKGINIALTATGIITSTTAASLKATIAPITTIVAMLGAGALAYSKWKGIRAGVNALAEGAEQREERIEGLDPALKRIYTSRDRGEEFAPADFRTLKQEFEHLTDDEISRVLHSTNLESAANKLKNLDVMRASQQAVLTSLWDPLEETLTKHSKGDNKDIELQLRQERARADLIKELQAQGVPFNQAIMREFSDEDIMAKMIESYGTLQFAAKTRREPARLLEGKIPAQAVDIPDMRKQFDAFKQQAAEYAEQMDQVGRAHGIGEMIQQAFMGSIIGTDPETTGSGVEAARLYMARLEEVTEETSEGILDQIRSLTYVSTQNIAERDKILYEGIARGIKGAENIENYLLEEKGIKPGTPIYRVLDYMLSTEGLDPADALKQVDLFFEETGQQLDELPKKFERDRIAQYNKDNFLLELFPNDKDKLEAKQEWYDLMVDIYSSIAQGYLAGYTQEGIPFADAIKKLKDEHGDLVRDLDNAINLSKSEKAFKQITDEVNNAASALLEISETPVETFERKLMALLDNLNLDKASIEYINFSDAIKRGAKNIAEAAYLTEQSNLQDVIDQLVMSEEEYFKHALAKKGISSDMFDELWNLKTLGDTKTKAKEAEDAYKDLSNSIMEAVLSGEAYQRFVYSDVNKYAADDVDKLVTAYKRLTSAQKVLSLSEEMEGTKTDYEDRLFKLKFPNAKNQALALMYRDYDAAVKEYGSMQKNGASTKELDAVSRKIDKMMDGINYVRKNFSAIVFGEREQELQQQLDAAKAVTDEEKIQAMVIEGISLDQAGILFYLQQQIDAYNELNSAAEKFKDFAKNNLYNEEQNFDILLAGIGLSDYTGAEDTAGGLVRSFSKPKRGEARINERNAKLEALATSTRDYKSSLISVFTDDTGNVDVDGLLERFGEIDVEALKYIGQIDELFPVSNALLFKDALADIGDELVKLGITGVVGMFEDWGNAIATNTTGAESFAQSLSGMLTSLVSALPQLFLSAGLSELSHGNPLGWALIAMSALSSLAKGYLEGKADATITGTTTGITLTKSAKGNLFSRGELLNSPTLFRTQSGFNLAGEQGTEAVMPLGRTSDGKLGIYAMGQNGGGQANVVVNVINNSDNSESEVVERTDANGTKTIDVIIKNIVNKQIAEGGYDRTLGSRYGVKNRGIA